MLLSVQLQVKIKNANNMKRLYIIIFLFLLSTSCNNNKIKLSKEELTRYNTTIQQLEEIETLYDKAVNSKNGKSLADLVEISQSISYEYNDEGIIEYLNMTARFQKEERRESLN